VPIPLAIVLALRGIRPVLPRTDPIPYGIIPIPIGTGKLPIGIHLITAVIYILLYGIQFIPIGTAAVLRRIVQIPTSTGKIPIGTAPILIGTGQIQYVGVYKLNSTITILHPQTDITYH